MMNRIKKHNSDVPGQLALFAIAPDEAKIVIHDSYWDEIVAPQQVEDDHWNPSHFGEVPHKVDGDGQLTIFYDDSDEPPDPEDYKNLSDYHQAWGEWEIRVGGQVTNVAITTTVETLVGGQVRLDTKKTAPQHDTHWVENYWVERGSNRYWYYRYCWMVVRKIHRRYIGSVDSPRARDKKQQIEIAIAHGLSPNQIQNLITRLRQQSSSHWTTFKKS